MGARILKMAVAILFRLLQAGCSPPGLMKLSLRIKLMGIIVLAGVLLLLVALMVVWTMGYRHRVSHQGAMFQSEASHVAHNLGAVIRQNIASLEALAIAGRLGEAIEGALPGLRESAGLAQRWPDLPAESPEIQSVLQNAVSQELRGFQTFDPLYVELLVADARGRLVAASDRTSDYDQSDEEWWQRAIGFQRGEALVSGLEFDESAGVFSLDISIPVFAGNADRPVGVLKAVVNASPLFSSVPVFAAASGALGIVATPGGEIMLRLSEKAFRPSGESLPPDVMARMRPDRPGWFVGNLNGRLEMVGFSPVHLLGFSGKQSDILGEPLYVLVSQPADEIVVPLRQRAAVTMAGGAVAILICALAGIVLAERNIMKPIGVLRAAARDLVRAVDDQKFSCSDPSRSRDPKAILRDIASVRTDDEMEDLAADFSFMAGKLLRYQDDLKREIDAKTREIRRDLDIAREFQQAFLPRDYPTVPSKGVNDLLTLNFRHVYQAAMSVSGDFFDLIKLNDHSAGVLIADVMGHGTRSALVTAILRTLLHGLADAAKEPGAFLSELNGHFYEAMRQTDQFVFVSACYVVFDTREATVRCASAGHPSPLLGNRNSGRITDFFGPLRGNPALGLFASRSYDVFSRPLEEDDVLLLYTDGVVEAMDGEDRDFGRVRLVEALGRHLEGDIATLTQAVFDEVLAFTGYLPPTDDICLVAVEAVPSRRASLLRNPQFLDRVRPGSFGPG